MKILHINGKEELTMPELVKRFEVLYNLNKDGSFYITSKIVRARERLELELKDKNGDSVEGGEELSK